MSDNRNEHLFDEVYEFLGYPKADLISGVPQIKKDDSIEARFLKTIDRYLMDSREDRDSVSIKPSSYYKCMRKTWYNLLRFPKKVKKYARSIRILECGTALHEWIQTKVLMPMCLNGTGIERLLYPKDLPVFGAEGVKFIKEHSAPDMEIKIRDYRFTSKYPVSAMVDGAFVFEGLPMLFEFKTIKSSDFKSLRKPLSDHIKQGALYALCYKITNVMFVYYNKDSQEMKAYLIKYGDDQITWALTRIQILEEYLLDLKLPPAEPDNFCKYCEYKHLCESNVSGTKFGKDSEGFAVVEKV